MNQRWLFEDSWTVLEMADVDVTLVEWTNSMIVIILQVGQMYMNEKYLTNWVCELQFKWTICAKHHSISLREYNNPKLWLNIAWSGKRIHMRINFQIITESWVLIFSILKDKYNTFSVELCQLRDCKSIMIIYNYCAGKL